MRLDGPYLGTAAAIGVLLWTQRRLARETAWGSLRLEVAALVKVAALVAGFLLGWGAFLATALATSLVWLERDRASLLVLGAISALAVLLGNLTAEAVDFADVTAGPLTFTLSVAQWTLPTALGILIAAVAGVVVPAIAWLTNRTSASGTSRASS